MSATSDAWPIYEPADAGQPVDAILSHIASHGVYTIADTAERATLIAALAAAGVNDDYVVARRLDAGAGRELEYTIDAGVNWRTVVTAMHNQWATAAGSVVVSISGSATGSAAITFPGSRFTQAPIVIATLNDASGYAASVASITTTGATITLRHLDGTTATLTRTVGWFAIQMLSGAAAG